jgi:hypothetical protein
MKFRKKPVVVEAMQYRDGGDNHRFINNDILPLVFEWSEPDASGTNQKCEAFCVTAHGHKTPVAPGDWVIAEPDGRGCYPCKPDIFAAIYEPAE